mgnify:CR=1 FL=1|jgi:ABC-2 type transport system permease protein
MTPKQLFFRRLRSEWKFKFAAWSTITDWTVALYIIIPALIIATISYIRLWNQLPAWAARLPIDMPLLLISLFAWTGTVRVFLEEADQLFLLQRGEWIRRIICSGIIYSAICSLLTTLLAFFILAPFLLLGYGLTVKELFLLFALAFLLKMNISFVTQFVSLRLKGWKEKAVLILLFIPTQVLFVKGVKLLGDNPPLNYACCLLLILALSLLVRIRLGIKGAFLDDISREDQEKLKYVPAILGVSGVNIKKPSIKRKKPVFFSRFNHIFGENSAANRLTEACIKSFLRNKNVLTSYLSLVFIGILFVRTPNWSMLILWPLLALALALWAKFHWVDLITSDYIKLFSWPAEDVHEAAWKSIFFLSTPGFLLISFTLGFSLFSWVGAFCILPAGFGLNHCVAKLVSMWKQRL